MIEGHSFSQASCQHGGRRHKQSRCGPGVFCTAMGVLAHSAQDDGHNSGVRSLSWRHCRRLTGMTAMVCQWVTKMALGLAKQKFEEAFVAGRIGRLVVR